MTALLKKTEYANDVLNTLAETPAFKAARKHSEQLTATDRIRLVTRCEEIARDGAAELEKLISASKTAFEDHQLKLAAFKAAGQKLNSITAARGVVAWRVEAETAQIHGALTATADPAIDEFVAWVDADMEVTLKAPVVEWPTVAINVFSGKKTIITDASSW